MIIRYAGIGDLEEMKILFRDTVAEVCIRDYNPEQIRVWISAAQDQQKWIDKIKSEYFLVAEKEGSIVGFGSLDKGDDIDYLYVHKDYQRQGIAYRLLLELEEEAMRTGSSIIKSTVSKTALPFFLKNKYAVLSENIVKLDGVELLNYKMKKALTFF